MFIKMSMNVLIAIDIFKSVPINISYQYFQGWPHQYYKKTIDILVIDMAHQYMEHPYEDRKGRGLTWRWPEIQLSQSDVDIMIYMIYMIMISVGPSPLNVSLQ